MYVCRHVHVHTCIDECVHLGMYVAIHTQVCMCIYVYMHE